MRDMWFYCVLILLLLLLLLSSCRGALVDQSVAINALETQGYRDIKVMDHSYFVVGFRGCGKEDAARFTAVAKNPIGKDVEVYVCTGWLFKGATIRTK